MQVGHRPTCPNATPFEQTAGKVHVADIYSLFSLQNRTSSIMMNMNIPFDTLDYAQQLAKAGVPAAQAEQQSKLLADVLGKSVAFPGDLATVERNVIAKVETSELKIDGRINTLAGEVNLTKWMLGTLIAMNIAILLKLFLR